MAELKKSSNRTLAKVALIIFLVLLLFFIASFFAFKSSRVQTKLGHIVTHSLSKAIGTEFSVGDIRIEFFNRIYVNEIYIEDLEKDTLLYIEEVEANFSYISLFKKQIFVDDVELKNLVFNLNRSYDDSLNNLSKLLKYTQDTTTQQASKKNEQTLFDLDLRINNTFLYNAKVRVNDKYAGFLLDNNLEYGELIVDNLDLNNLNFELQSIMLTKPTVSLTLLKKNPNIKPFFPVDSFSLPFGLSCKEILLNKGSFHLTNNAKEDTTKTTSLSKNLAINNINIDIENIALFRDSIFMNLKHLSAAEKQGVKLKKVSGALSFNNKNTVLSDFILLTNNSSINLSASANYKDLNSIQNAVNEVYFDLDLNSSKIDLRDMRMFVDIPQLKMSDKVTIKGHASGRVKNFKVKDIFFKTAKNTLLEGEVSFNGLPNINTTFISGHLTSFKTDYFDLQHFLPKVTLPQNIKKLGVLSFVGNFDGFIKDFVAFGNLNTALGAANTDINLKFDDQSNAVYKGNISLQKFNIGEFFNLQDILGSISLEAKAEGKGIQLNTLDVNVNGLVKELEFKGYSYENILIDGKVKNKFFTGTLDLNNHDIGLKFNGEVDATTNRPLYNFKAILSHFNPNNLHLFKSDMIFSANLNADFSFNTINDIVGTLDIKNLLVNKNDKDYKIGDITLASLLFKNGTKRITGKGESFDIDISGAFEPLKIADAMRSILLPTEKKVVENQIMKFNILVDKNPEILALLVPQLTLKEDVKISGNFNSDTQHLLAIVDAPIIQYNNLSFFKTNINAYINKGSYDMMASIPQVYLNDSSIIHNSSLLVNGPRNNLDIILNVESNETNSVQLFADLVSKNKRQTLSFKPSNIFLNGTKWHFNENNEINFGIRTYTKDFIVSSGTSSIGLNLDIDKEKQKANVNLNNIYIEDFTKFLEAKNIKLSGVLNGNVNISRLNNLPVLDGAIIAEKLKVNTFDIGNLNLNAGLDAKNQNVKINGNLFGKQNDVDINGVVSYAPEITPRDINIEFDVNNLAVSSVEDFIQEYIDNASGTVSGKVILSGPRNRLDLLGFLDINDVTTTVSYLQTSFNIKKQRVHLDKNAIHLGNNIKIVDAEGNIAYGSGKITHRNLKDFALDIDTWGDKILGLNTTEDDNEAFYGKAYLDGTASFKGPFNDVAIRIGGKTVGDTEITLPVGNYVDNQSFKFYSFVKKKKPKDEFVVAKKEKFKLPSLTLNIDVELTESCKVNIILDETSGDVLQMYGEGNVKIFLPKEGDIQLFGKYFVSSGDYLFTLQNIVNKRFKIDPGSTVNFLGPIEDTRVVVDAVYNVRAAPKNLIAEFLTENTQEASEASNRVPVKLLLSLRNRLFKPDINFDIRVEQLAPSLKDDVDRKISTIKQYQNELNRQVFGLLVLNQFLPPLSSFNQLANGVEFTPSNAANTVSEFVSNQFSKYFNDWLSNFSDDVSVNFNYRNYQQDALIGGIQESSGLRRELQLAVSTRFLNDRVTLNVGGNVDFGENRLGTSTQPNSSTYFGGNFSLEYALTKNRRFRIRAFTNTNYDYFYNNNTTRAGVGLSFKREFDKAKEIRLSREEFKIERRKKKDKKQATKSNK